MNGQLRREDEELRKVRGIAPTSVRRDVSGGQARQNPEPDRPTQKMDRTPYNLHQTQPTRFFANKSPVFKSRYINENGRWTQNAVDEGFVDVKDYISDIKNDEQGISFNGKEMKISDDFQPEKKVEDFQLNENKQDDTEYASWWDDRKEDAEKIVDIGRYYANEGQKWAQREVWKWGAQNILREDMGCETSAWLLEHSLQDNPSDVERGNDSRIAYLVNTSEEYLSELDKLIKKSKSGVIENGELEVIFGEKTSPDLYYSIHKATIYVNGYKIGNGQWYVEANFEDEYNFSEFMTFMGDKENEFSKKISKGTIANDAAHISELLGAISPYWIRVKFCTIR
ncbi:MAG: hypothetical protein IJC09_01565 [Clostridia bacterium]|nr:hypothetical protein [Clostridia bacterium]